MDVREKLVELVHTIYNDPRMQFHDLYEMNQEAETIADIMIENGVTVQDNAEITDELLKRLRNAPLTVLHEEPTIEVVQEWISTDEIMPTEDDATDGYVAVVYFRADGVQTRTISLVDVVIAHPDLYDYWMPLNLPQPPKGE